MNWAPWFVFGGIILGVWMPYMRSKDRSLSRYAEYGAYKAHTRSFFPFLF